MRSSLLPAACLAALSGCFAPERPDCAFSCGSFNSFHCPDDYTCNMGDGYCHRKDFVGVCPFAKNDQGAGDQGRPDQGMGDMAVATGDMAMSTEDMAMSMGDMAMSMPDMAMPADLAEAPDMVAVPDLVNVPDLVSVPDLVMTPDLADPCRDGMKNGAETDVDCGGGTCPKCLLGKACLVNADCLSDMCTMQNVCM